MVSKLSQVPPKSNLKKYKKNKIKRARVKLVFLVIFKKFCFSEKTEKSK
jgi:hypothetical protein